MLTSETFTYAGIVAVCTMVATFWGQVKTILARMASFVVVQVNIDDGDYNTLTAYMLKNFKRSPFDRQRFAISMDFVRPKDKKMIIAFEPPPTGTFFWKGLKPIWISRQSSSNTEPVTMGSKIVCFLRGTFDIEKIICDAVDERNNWLAKTTSNSGLIRYRIRYVQGDSATRKLQRLGRGDDAKTSEEPMRAPPPYDLAKDDTIRVLQWKSDEIGPRIPNSKNPTEMLILSKDAKEAVEEAKFWKESREWYSERAIPWKRGWLLYGRPGTGKTSLARAIAQELDMPVWVFDLPTLNNEELRQNWSRMCNTAPCMALIEDIDGTFDGRKNTACDGKMSEGVTFDCLLNCIDGIESSDGIMTILTTNKLEKIDSAIGRPDSNGGSSRPGRIDRAIEMQSPDKDGLLRVARRILDENPELGEKLADEAIKNDDTVCQFQEKCAQIALRLRWEKFNTKRGQQSVIRLDTEADQHHNGDRPAKEASHVNGKSVN